VTYRKGLVFAAGVVLLVQVFGPAVQESLANFNSTSANASNSMSAARIFAGSRSMSAWSLQDVSSGTAANKSDPVSFAGDSLTDRSNGSIASGSNVYFEFTMSSPLPAGFSVSSPQFNFPLASQGGPGAGNGCFWFEVRSGASVIGTHGSYASAAGGSNKGTLATFSTAIPEVTTTDLANGIVIRAYAWETAGKKVDVDLATVTGSTPYGTFTQYETSATDTSSGSVTTTWSLNSVDAVTFTSAGAFPTAATTTKYLQLSFDPGVPTGAVISTATLNFVYRPSAAVSSPGLCYYVDVFQSTTLLGSHGSSSSAYSCNTSATNFVTDPIPLSEVNSAARADSLVVKIYMWGPGCGQGCPKGVVDQGQLALNYSLA